MCVSAWDLDLGFFFFLICKGAGFCYLFTCKLFGFGVSVLIFMLWLSIDLGFACYLPDSLLTRFDFIRFCRVLRLLSLVIVDLV